LNLDSAFEREKQKNQKLNEALLDKMGPPRKEPSTEKKADHTECLREIDRLKSNLEVSVQTLKDKEKALERVEADLGSNLKLLN